MNSRLSKSQRKPIRILLQSKCITSVSRIRWKLWALMVISLVLSVAWSGKRWFTGKIRIASTLTAIILILEFCLINAAMTLRKNIARVYGNWPWRRSLITKSIVMCVVTWRLITFEVFPQKETAIYFQIFSSFFWKLEQKFSIVTLDLGVGWDCFIASENDLIQQNGNTYKLLRFGV